MILFGVLGWAVAAITLLLVALAPSRVLDDVPFGERLVVRRPDLAVLGLGVLSVGLVALAITALGK